MQNLWGCLLWSHTQRNSNQRTHKNPIKIFNQAKNQQLHQEKGKFAKNENWKIKVGTLESHPHTIEEVKKPPKIDIRL